MLKEIGSVFSFLTIIPTGTANLETIAKYMYLFPVVGIAIGLIVGGFGFGLSFIGLEPLIVGLLVVAAIALITGIHHTDGLADFADGLMTKGTKEKKLQAMKDLSVGSAGIVTVVLYIVGMIIALSFMEGYFLFQAILVSEIMAKFSMVLMASAGQSAALGSNSPFVQLSPRDRNEWRNTTHHPHKRAARAGDVHTGQWFPGQRAPRARLGPPAVDSYLTKPICL